MLRNLKFLSRNLLYLKKNYFAHVDYSYDTRDFLTKVDDYEKKVDDHKTNMFEITDSIIPGNATPEGTLKYSNSNPSEGNKVIT